jgi:hypothetical protein
MILSLEKSDGYNSNFGFFSFWKMRQNWIFFHELDVAVPFEDTIFQSEPVPPSTKETSPAVTHNEPNGIPKLTQNKDEPA